MQVDAGRKMTLNILDRDVVLMDFLADFLHFSANFLRNSCFELGALGVV